MTPLRQQFLQDLELAGLSGRTCEAYSRAVWQLAKHYHQCPSALPETQVRDYLSHLKNDRQFAAGSLKIVYSALKFLYRCSVPRGWKTLDQLRVPRESKLPVVLTIEEVQRLIGAIRSDQCRACLWTIYSLGLRLSEGLSLRVGDIDAARGLVHIHCGKGARDRYVPLPCSALGILRRYWLTHRHPILLFPALGRGGKSGHSATHTLPKATLQGALRLALREVGIHKRVSVHSLRHSYATHLLEVGVNLRIIQKHLGHKVLQSTTVYLHLTSKGDEHACQIIEELMANQPPPPAPDCPRERT